MRKTVYVIPVAVLLVMAAFFLLQLTSGKNPREIPSVLIEQPVPDFDLAPIKGRQRGFSSADLKGQVSLVNIFGSWCIACREEHPFLMDLKTDGVIPIFGIDWREKDAEAGPTWLRRWGDPYTLVGDDPLSRAAIAFGVTGAPESFIVDAQGTIRYKHIGPITEQAWEDTLWPIIQELRGR